MPALPYPAIPSGVAALGPVGSLSMSAYTDAGVIGVENPRLRMRESNDGHLRAQEAGYPGRDATLPQGQGGPGEHRRRDRGAPDPRARLALVGAREAHRRHGMVRGAALPV